MITRVTAVVCLLLAAISLTAQVPHEEPVVPEPPAVEALIPEPPEPVPAEERELTILASPGTRPARIAAQSDVIGANGDLLFESPPSPFESGVVLRATTGPLGFFTNGAARMRIFDDGNVSIGSSSNLGRLLVTNATSNLIALNVGSTPYVTTNSTQHDWAAYLYGAHVVSGGVTNSGSMTAIRARGVLSGAGVLNSTTGILVESGVQTPSTGTVNTAYGALVQLMNGAGTGTLTNGYAVFLQDVPATNGFGVYQAGANDTNYFSGKVGIGTAAPNRKLMVLSSESGGAFLAQQTSTYTANATAYEGSGVTAMYTIVNAGVTKSGTAVAHRGVSWLQGSGTLDGAYGLYGEVGVLPGHSGTITNGYGFYAAVNKNNGSMVNGYALYIADVTATNGWGVYQTAGDDRNYFAGNVLIGTTSSPTGAKLEVNGNANFNGTVTGTKIQAHYQDVAEWVPSAEDLAPGTVVVLDKRIGNRVRASMTAYDTAVAGVVSAQPGIILGEESASKEQVATTGRVRVRVDASRGPVEIGDLLVTSDIPGTAMRSEAMEINGRRFHQPGTIIGKALEPLEGGVEEILVLLSLQ